ncbi:MAG TPA: serine hydrolase, partial [Ktedonobacterales bacterium]
TQAAMTTPTRLTDGHTVGYGMGWGLSTYRGKCVIHHAGGVPGYSAFYGRFPDDDLSIIVLSNWNLFDAGGLAAPIADLLLDLPTPQHSPIALEPGALARMTGAYTNLIGDALSITPGDGVLHVSGELSCDLIPLSATNCVSASHPDTQVHFANEGPDGFERATVTVPFYWYELTRTQSSKRDCPQTRPCITCGRCQMLHSECAEARAVREVTSDGWTWRCAATSAPASARPRADQCDRRRSCGQRRAHSGGGA